MDPIERPPRIVRWTLRRADNGARPISSCAGPAIHAVFGTGTRAGSFAANGSATRSTCSPTSRSARGPPPVWPAFAGGPDMSATGKLVGTGLLAAGTAWTGWAEWSAAGSRDKRVGLVHAVTNGVAIGIYAASWFARRQGTARRWDERLAGAAVSGVAAYLGGHLPRGRKVATVIPQRRPAGNRRRRGAVTSASGSAVASSVSLGLPRAGCLVGDPAAVGGHGEDVRDDEDADTPGEGDPDVGAGRLLCEQVADGVDDGRHRLVLGEGAHRAGHGLGGHERRADERQEDERVGERARAVRGVRGKTRG